jgi:HAD superfamily hydrolase (TIGR01549 family)
MERRGRWSRRFFFDFYNTLVRFWPPLDEIQQASCRELGLNVAKEGIRKGYVLADAYMSAENSKVPLAERTVEERGLFFAEYERLVIKGAGVDVTLRLAEQVWEMATQIPKDFDLFEDVLSGLELLKKRGIILGVITNLRGDMGEICERLGLTAYLDFCVTSTDSGTEKPHAPIFLTALKRAQVEPGEAVHVGDQYHSDVRGAREVGITPVLMDREGWHQDITDCPRIASVPDLDRLITEGL